MHYYQDMFSGFYTTFLKAGRFFAVLLFLHFDRNLSVADPDLRNLYLL